MNRILFAYPEASPLFLNGGIGTFVYEAALLLSKSGRWEVDILTDISHPAKCTKKDFLKAEAAFLQHNVRLMDLRRRDGVPTAWHSADIVRAERYHRQITELHRQKQYDVIEFPDWRAPGFFVIREKNTLQTFSDAVLVTHCHSSTKNVWDWFNGYFSDRNDFYCDFMENYIKKYSDAVISPSEFMLRDFRLLIPNSGDRIFRNAYPISPLRKDVSTPVRQSGPVLVACISRLERRKGQDILAAAIRNIRTSEQPLDEVEFVFCGKDGLGNESDGVMSRTVSRILPGISGWSIIPPMEREQLMDWLLHKVDVCIVPSRRDNYPNVVLEAARAGCYVIASNIGGIPEIFQDYAITGSLFPFENDHELEQEIRKAVEIIRSEPGIRKRLCLEFEQNRQKQEQRILTAYDQISQLKKQQPATLPESLDPMVSIIIPFYNDHLYARDAISSAFASKYSNFEVILIDDGSDDPQSIQFLVEMQVEFPDLKIIHKKNGGLGDARNAGCKSARGEFIVPLDSDNILLPDMLRVCSRVLLRRPNLSYVTTYFECLKENGSRITWRESPIARPIGAVNPLLLLENSVGDALSMIRKSDIEEVGGYSTKIYCFEDWDLWLKLHSKGKEGDVIPEVLFIYRLRTGSMSRSLDAKSGLRVQQTLLTEHADLLKGQSFGVATLLLREYWFRWRATKRSKFRFFKRVLKGVKNPARAWESVTNRIAKKVRG